jgi:hypothetical protein
VATAKAQSLQNDLNLKLSCADTNSSACVQGAGALYAYTDDTGLPAVLIGTQRTDQNLIQSDYFGTSSFSTWQDLKATYYELQIGSYQPPTAGQIASGELQGVAATVFPFINQDEGPNPNNPFVPFQPGLSAPSLMAGQPAGVQQGYSAGQQIGQMLWMVGGEAIVNSAPSANTTALNNQPLILLTSEGKADAFSYQLLKADLASAQASDPLFGTTLPGANAPITVTAESSVGGQTFFDTNPTARPANMATATPTLVADSTAPSNPNVSMDTAHAEIGNIQQAYLAGVTQGRDMTMIVRTGPEVSPPGTCSYCSDVLANAVEAARLKTLTIFDTGANLQRVWINTGSGVIYKQAPLIQH